MSIATWKIHIKDSGHMNAANSATPLSKVSYTIDPKIAVNYMLCVEVRLCKENVKLLMYHA